MNKDTIKFQYYPAKIRSNKPIGVITLEQFIFGHKHPKQQTIDIFKRIADAEKAKDWKQKAELKQKNLHYFTPSVFVDGYRRYANISHFTGLMPLDFDHLPDPEYAEEFKQFLFDKYQFIIAVWLSASKHGVKPLVNIPVVSTVEEFKSLFYGIEKEMEQYEGWDPAPKNAVLPLFQSYDPRLLFRDDPDLWIDTAIKETEYKYKGETIPPPIIEVDDKDKFRVIKIIHSGMEAIDDPGHPQLRSLCLSVGGYVASGYISMLEAEQLIHHLIETHHYLSKGISGYKKTATWALNEGTRKPIVLERHGVNRT